MKGLSGFREGGESSKGQGQEPRSAASPQTCPVAGWRPGRGGSGAVAACSKAGAIWPVAVGLWLRREAERASEAVQKERHQSLVTEGRRGWSKGQTKSKSAVGKGKVTDLTEESHLLEV